jgi:hypothetical protein
MHIFAYTDVLVFPHMPSVFYVLVTYILTITQYPICLQQELSSGVKII